MDTQQKRVNKSKLKRKKRRKRIRRIILVELLILLIIIPVVYTLYQLNRIPRQSLDLESIEVNQIDLDELKDYHNIAIFGVDSRANDLKKNTRSDSIMVLSINKKTNDIKVCSIYRDTYVKIKDHGYTKVNHSYSYGGPALAINTLNTNLDLNITDFITVNFSAVTHMVDLLGGITLDIKEDELDYVNAYTRDVARINGTKFHYLKKAGKQKVDGTQATAYCRVRYTAGGDFTRAQRQRTVLNEIFNETKHASVTTLMNIANEMIPQVYTSLSNQELVLLGKDIFFYKMKGQEGFPFDKTAKRINGTSFVLAETLSSNVTKLHEFLFQQNNYKPSKTVQERSSVIASK